MLRPFPCLLFALLLFCGVVTGVAGCRAASFRDLAVPASSFNGDEADEASPAIVSDVRKLTDLAYGADDKQKLDVYLPASPKNAPTIVMVHGGAWFIGDKKHSGVVKHKVEYWVKQKGYIFVSVNYRLVPDANPLQQAEDVGAAIAYVQRNLPQWGGDPHQLVIMGHSAGAHLVALLGAKPGIAWRMGAQPWRATIVLDSAAMDIVSTMERKHYFFYDKAFGEDRGLWLATSPLQQLTPAATPMLIACSTRRPDKPCDQAKIFIEKAHGMNLIALLQPEDKKHGPMSGDLGTDMTYTAVVDNFITRYVGVR